MSKIIKEIFEGKTRLNHLHPFTALSADDTREVIEARILDYKEAGIYSMNLLWSGRRSGPMFQLSAFNCDEYWERMKWISDICREHGMTYMMQDAAPFPTGQADGWFEKEENYHLNKLYLEERHLDVKGPNPEGAFLIRNMIDAIRGGDVETLTRGMKSLPGARLISVVAMPHAGENYDYSRAVDLTDQVVDGILSWEVPEGIWRLFVVFETHNWGGRAFYMNLLDEESVALNIAAVHQPHYEHLKEEIGKTWLGFFYDETEVGNLNGYAFNAMVGTGRNMEGESQALPWSKKMEGLCAEALGKDYRKLLPLLWFQDAGEYHRVRCSYMDQASRLIQENYNGQMHKWCKERGILYIGHNLEDENSHCRLSCGPVHYFRMQAHQDMGGIDLIGNQVMPGKDFKQAWYGYQDADGQFYHYGLAKLASSAGHIAPDKNGRSFCEVFAVYGALAGSRLRKFMYDYLFVNGVNEMIPADPYVPGVDRKYSLAENNYANRMCHLLQNTKAVIKTALLYHAEAEWYGGKYQMFQVPASELAKHQISYDVIPADVFENVEFYQTDISDGLIINGNRYDALVIPGAEALPKAAARFLARAKETGFPVFFSDFAPTVLAETGVAYTPECGVCVALSDLADSVKKAIATDIRLAEEAPDLRYAHFCDGEGQYYFLQNQGKSMSTNIWFPYQAPVYQLDMKHLKVEKLQSQSVEDGSTVRFDFAEWESALLYFGELDVAVEAPCAYSVKETLTGNWNVALQDDAATTMELSDLININGATYFPQYSGVITYETTVNWDKTPTILDLGAVYEIASVYVNGQLAGEEQSSPYRFDISGVAVAGENALRIEVQTNTARSLNPGGRRRMVGGMTADTYNSLDPGGLMGPVTVYYK